MVQAARGCYNGADKAHAGESVGPCGVSAVDPFRGRRQGGCGFSDATSRTLHCGSSRALSADADGVAAGECCCRGKSAATGSGCSWAGFFSHSSQEARLRPSGGQQLRREGRSRRGCPQGHLGRPAPSIGPWCRLRQTHGPVSHLTNCWRRDVIHYDNFVSPWFGQVLGLWANFVVAIQDLLPRDHVICSCDPRLEDAYYTPARPPLVGVKADCCNCEHKGLASWFTGAHLGGGVIAWSGANQGMDSLPVVEPSLSLAPSCAFCTGEPGCSDPSVVQRAHCPTSSTRGVPDKGTCTVLA